jgi:type I restriction enzyme S subunit
MRELAADTLPDSWAVVPLHAIVDSAKPITYGILKPGPDAVNGVPYVRVTDFKTGKVVISHLRKTTSTIAAEYRRSTLAGGDLLFAIRGTVGHVASVPPELDGANITQDTARLAIDERVSTAYVMMVLRSPGVQQRITRAVKGVAVRGINLGDLRELLVPLPPRDEQDVIVSRAESIDAMWDTVCQRVDKAFVAASDTKAALLAKALRSELPISEA